MLYDPIYIRFNIEITSAFPGSFNVILLLSMKSIFFRTKWKLRQGKAEGRGHGGRGALFALVYFFAGDKGGMIPWLRN